MVGGERHELGGSFFQPTLMVDVSSQMMLAHEETFGPVAPLFRFETEEQAIDMANDTEFGLAAYFFSQNLGRVWRVSEHLEYGMVGINSGLYLPQLPLLVELNSRVWVERDPNTG